MRIITAWTRPLSILVVLALVAAGGFACTEVKEGMEDADKTLAKALGEDPRYEGLSGVALADAIYQRGLVLQSEGKDQEAFEHFSDAAERGNAAAAYDLGAAYNAGRGVDKDLNAGAKWINVAAERRDPRALYAVGAALYNGDGVAQDYTRAAGYLADAAEQGHAGAQYLLGECYANGRGVTKNLSWAARWYGKAAEQAQPDGAFSFGVVQAAGLGLPTNLVAGYAWLDIASNLGHGKAGEVRAAIANKMSPAQIERGKATAKAFVPQSDASPAEGSFADKPTVMYVQHSLNRVGFNAGKVDGLMGPRTRSAISAYLSSQGESNTDSEVTPTLLRRLFEGQQGTA